MESITCLEDLYRSLILQCVGLPTPNKEMELSIFQSLFYDRRYDLVLEGLEKGMTLTQDVTNMILKSWEPKLYQHILEKDAVGNDTERILLWECAVLEQQLPILKLLHSYKVVWYPRSIWQRAIQIRNLEIIEWLYEIGCPFHEVICHHCVYKGDLQLLQWFRNRGCPWDRDHCLLLSQLHNMAHIVQWIESQPE